MELIIQPANVQVLSTLWRWWSKILVRRIWYKYGVASYANPVLLQKWPSQREMEGEREEGNDGEKQHRYDWGRVMGNEVALELRENFFREKTMLISHFRVAWYLEVAEKIFVGWSWSSQVKGPSISSDHYNPHNNKCIVSSIMQGVKIHYIITPKYSDFTCFKH